MSVYGNSRSNFLRSRFLIIVFLVGFGWSARTRSIDRRAQAVIGSRGLGFDVGGSPDWRIDASGQYVDCNEFISGLFHSVCWGAPGYQGSNPANITGVTPPPVDCSQFANVANSQCTLGQYLSLNLVNFPVMLIVGGVVALLFLRR